MADFLEGLAEGLAGQSVPLEAIMTGKAEDLPPRLAAKLRGSGIAARFLEPCREASYLWRDWMNAVTAAQADFIMHADEHTRFLSASGLARNLELARTSPKDILHFKAPNAGVPSFADLQGKAVLFYFLNSVIASCEIISKIYARPLCVKACGELDRAGRAGGMAESVFLHLLLAGLADDYSGKGRGVTQWRPPDNALEDHAREAAVLYDALGFFPECFARLGHPEESVRLAQYRLRAEFAFALGRVCRSPAGDIEASNAARHALSLFFSKADLLDALLLGTAQNAGKIAEIYRVIFEDTVYNPCPMFGIQKFPLPEPIGQAENTGG